MLPVFRKVAIGLLNVLAGIALLLIVLRHYGYFVEQTAVQPAEQIQQTDE